MSARRVFDELGHRVRENIKIRAAEKRFARSGPEIIVVALDHRAHEFGARGNRLDDQFPKIVQIG